MRETLFHNYIRDICLSWKGRFQMLIFLAYRQAIPIWMNGIKQFSSPYFILTKFNKYQKIWKKLKTDREDN